MKSYLVFLRENIFALKLKNWIHYLLLAVQIFALSVSIVAFVNNNNNLKKYDIPMSSFELLAGSYADGVTYIEETNGEATHFMIGPYMPLERGSYHLTVEYESTHPSAYLFGCDQKVEHDAILSDKYILDENSTTFSTDIIAQRDLPQFECRIMFLGQGTLRVSSVVLEETDLLAVRDCLYVVGAIIFIQLLYFAFYCYKKNGEVEMEKKFVFMGLAMIVLLASYPLSLDYMFNGHDLTFHLTRIEGIKDGLLSGQFPVRVQPGWWKGAGYATSIYYADTFLYIPAILRIFGASVQDAYRIYLFLCNIATCGIAYYSFEKLTKHRKAALIGTLLYTTSMYRLTCMYLRAAVGEATAMTFLPLVLYGFIRIVNTQGEEIKKPRLWLPLTLGMTGLVNCHILSSEMTVLMLIILCIIFIKKIFADKRWIILMKAAMATVLINLWFLIPFLDYYTDQPNISMPTNNVDIQQTGTYLGQLFMSFVPTIKTSLTSDPLALGIANDMPINLGFSTILLGGLVLFLFLRRRELKDGRIRESAIIAMVGVIFALFSWYRFPWNEIAKWNETLKSFIFSVQFLWRYLGIAILCLCAAGAISLAVYSKNESESRKNLVGGVIAAIAIIMSLHFNDSIIANGNIVRLYTSESVECAWDSFYLPYGSNTGTYWYTREPFSEAEEVTIGNVDRDGLNMDIEVSNTGEEAVLKLPLVYYEGYKAYDKESGEELRIDVTEEKLVGVYLPAGYAGEVDIDFVGKWHWRVSEAISLLTVIGIAGFAIRDRRKNKKAEKTICAE